LPPRIVTADTTLFDASIVWMRPLMSAISTPFGQVLGAATADVNGTASASATRPANRHAPFKLENPMARSLL
jgi:hypothetical protein